MSSFVLCVECGEPLYGFSPCRWCTCERCGIDLRDGFCPLCNSRNSCVYDPNPNSFDCPPDSYHPPHPTYETYSGDSCGIDSNLGYDCPPQFPLNYEPEPGYIQNYNSYPHDSPSFPQQCLCCDNCGGLHETFNDALGTKQYKPEDIQELFRQLLNDVKNIHEELAEYINTPGWNRPVFYDDDDDDDDVDYTIAITHVLSTEEPVDSLSMEDKHLDTIPATESDEEIKSSVEDLVPIPSESEGILNTMCDVHLVNNPTPLEAKDHFEIVIN
nr:pre-mRNA splicing Prp18-interacting factor [Tanacetum cinerariifolium]